jgi:protein-disulfide isomerase
VHQATEYDMQRRQLDIDYRRALQATLEDRLDKLLDRRAIELEADARKTTAIKLLGEVKTPPVTDAEIRALYEARKVPGAPEFEQVAGQLRDGLEQQKTEAALKSYYAGLRAKYKVTGSLDPLRSTVAVDGPSRGPADASVTIVEFADFQCPYCRRLEPELNDILKRYPTQVRIVYKHYPLDDIHPQALHAAQAAVCAGKQGKFWEVHDAIFADTTPLSLNSLRAIAQRADIDSSKFEECVRSQDPNTVISADIRAGNDVAVRSTPALFLNGRFIEGAVPEEKLVSVIEDELKR